jgi:hypothetical protein
MYLAVWLVFSAWKAETNPLKSGESSESSVLGLLKHKIRQHLPEHIPEPEWPDQPYLPLHGGGHTGPSTVHSPDPLHDYVWPPTINASVLQQYVLPPAVVDLVEFGIDSMQGPFEGLETLVNCSADHPADVAVRGFGSIRIDFGVETPGWLEFVSPDMPENATVSMSIGESNEPAYIGQTSRLHGFKTNTPTLLNGGAPMAGGGRVFRLVTKRQPTGVFYEGVRYGFITVSPDNSSALAVPGALADAPPIWHITLVRLVVQAKVVNYTGHFSAKQFPLLDDIYYTGAYTVRANMGAVEFGSILMNRGDRVVFAGDANPTQSAAMAAFGAFQMVLRELKLTNGNNSIPATNVPDQSYWDDTPTYTLCWVLSVFDYYRATNESEVLRLFAPAIARKLDRALEYQGKGNYLTWVGWDERLGYGGDFACIPEAQRVYTFLIIQTCAQFSQLLSHAYVNASMAAVYQQAPDALVVEVRSDANWTHSLGIHSAAGAITGGWTTADENAQLISRKSQVDDSSSLYLNDITQVCSFSPFNSYFILQAFGAHPGLDSPDRAVAMLARCWGSMLRLGATTFWEVAGHGDWDLVLQPHEQLPNHGGGYTSQAHPWAAGPTSWMPQQLLGVRPANVAGYAETIIRPMLLAVSGTVPTPLGVVRVAFDASASGCRADRIHGCTHTHTVALPRGITAVVWLPLSPQVTTVTRMMVTVTVESSSVEHLVSVKHAVFNASRLTIRDQKCSRPSNVSVYAVACRHVKLPMQFGHGEHKFLVAIQERVGSEIVSTAPPSLEPQAPPPPSPSLAFPPANYDATLLPLDRTTRGNWVGKKGKEGYVLYDWRSCWHQPNCTSDVISLPGFVNYVSTNYTLFSTKPTGSQCVGVLCWSAGRVARSVQWLSNYSDCNNWHGLPGPKKTPLPNAAAALQAPPMYAGAGADLGADAIKIRGLGARASVVAQPFPLDILFESPRCVKLSLYFCDWDSPATSTRETTNETGQMRRQAIGFYGTATETSPMKVIAPTMVVDNFQRGVYTSFEYTGSSVHLRLARIRGGTSVLSGIFFDKCS